MKNHQAVILVYSTSHAIRIEKLLNEIGVPCRLVPVPRHLSSDCGVCVRIDRNDIDLAMEAVKTGQVEIDGFFEI
jgi:hypothetical protein